MTEWRGRPDSPNRPIARVAGLAPNALSAALPTYYSNILNPYFKVLQEGLEPPLLTEYAPKAYVSTSFTTGALSAGKEGFEPTTLELTALCSTTELHSRVFCVGPPGFEPELIEYQSIVLTILLWSQKCGRWR